MVLYGFVHIFSWFFKGGHAFVVGLHGEVAFAFAFISCKEETETAIGAFSW